MTVRPSTASTDIVVTGRRERQGKEMSLVSTLVIISKVLFTDSEGVRGRKMPSNELRVGLGWGRDGELNGKESNSWECGP